MFGEAALCAGRLSEASSALDRAVRLLRSAQAPSAVALGLVRAAETEIARGRRWQASRLLDRATDIAQATPLAAHLVVRAYAAKILAAKTQDRAIATLSEAERVVLPSPTCQPCSIGFYVTAATTSARSGDFAKAQQYLDRAERIAGMWQGGPWHAAVWEARGALRIATGNRAQGAALLREAASLFADAGRPLDAARCREAASAEIRHDGVMA